MTTGSVMSWTLLLTCLATVGPLVVNCTPSSNSNNGLALGQLLAAESSHASNANNGYGLTELLRHPSDDSSNGNSGQGIDRDRVPTFDSVEELCDWLCRKHSPRFNYGCPPSCHGGILDSWSKRGARRRRYDDFSFGFDDYLFMKLLGRNLGDRT